MDRLINGYRRFRSERWPIERERFERLASGQQPRSMVIACSDSRVDPSMIFGTAPGELFVHRWTDFDPAAGTTLVTWEP